MSKFVYVAKDGKGKEVKGTLEAASPAQAQEMLRQNGLFPTKLGQAKSSSMDINIKLPAFLRPKVKTKDLCILTRQLATLVDSGLPLVRGLRILQKQTKNSTLKDTLGQMTDAVESGSNFSEALAQHPKIFNNLYVNMAKAGEAGGVLEQVLNRLAEFLEKAERIKNKVKSAMTYPIVVLCAAVGITGFLIVGGRDQTISITTAGGDGFNGQGAIKNTGWTSGQYNWFVGPGQVEKFLKRQGLCTGIGNVVGRVFFEPVHPVFYAELFNDHSLSPWK